MNIDSVKSSRNLSDSLQIQNKQQNQKKENSQVNKFQQPQDKLELSPEARGLKPIEAKMKSGFYDKPDVLKVVAQKLNQELSPSNIQ